MRFFSNDAKDSADEQGSDEHPERVQSDPVTVPQQRAGSPWSDPRSPADPTPADADLDSHPDNVDAESADREQTDSDTPVNGYDPTASHASPSDTDSPGYESPEPVRDESADRHDGDGLVPSSADESAEAPASDGLGAHRVEVNDYDAEDPADRTVDPDDVTSTDVDDERDSDRLGVQDVDDERDDAVDLPLEEPETADDSQVQSFHDDDTRLRDETIDTATDGTPADESPVATTTTYGPDGTVTTTAGSEEDGSSDSDLDSPTPAADLATSDSDLATSDADLATSDADLATSDAEDDGYDGDAAVKDEGGYDDPTAVDPATEEPLGSTSTDDESVATSADEADATPEVVPVPVPVPVGSTADENSKVENGKVEAGGDKLPGTVTAPEFGSLFDSSDAQNFQERWREVQLRFVDSPKDATGEAARLVDEAVDKLTASLKGQKDQLSNGDSSDTEQLRVELRGYRDILNRVLKL